LIGRLGTRGDFDALRRHGQRARSGPLQLQFLASASTPGSIRVGYAIGRSVGNAVIRNRIRRRLRAIMTDLSFSESLRPSGDYLIRVQPAASQATFTELKDWTQSMLGDLKARS